MIPRFAIHDVEKGYYADKEDAYDMRLDFKDATGNMRKKIGSGGVLKKPRRHGEDTGKELSDLQDTDLTGEGGNRKSVGDGEDGDGEGEGSAGGEPRPLDPPGAEEGAASAGPAAGGEAEEGAASAGPAGGVDKMAEDNPETGAKKKKKK